MIIMLRCRTGGNIGATKGEGRRREHKVKRGRKKEGRRMDMRGHLWFAGHREFIDI